MEAAGTTRAKTAIAWSSAESGAGSARVETVRAQRETSAAVVVTVLDEVETVSWLVEGLAGQRVLPAMVIVVDGGSEDGTVEKLGALQQLHPELNLEVMSEPGSSIAAARNRGVERAGRAGMEWIAFTDAGCQPEPGWLEGLLDAQERTAAPVVAGFYRGWWRTPLQRAMIPFVLVMPDKLDLAHFLPASRSMLIERGLFERLGGFPDQTAVSEDYAFSRTLLEEIGHEKIAVTPAAVVQWRPRDTVEEFFWQIYTMARDDILLGNWRLRVWGVFGRYLLGAGAVAAVWVLWGLVPAVGMVLLGGLLYLTAATARHRRYTVGSSARYWTPLLQVVVDAAVMLGTVVGSLKRFSKM